MQTITCKIVKRNLYYCCRLVSSQYGTEFTNSHYEKIKKVYSIFICMNPPNYRKSTINQYSIQEEFGIKMTQELEREVSEMCNLSEGVNRRVLRKELPLQYEISWRVWDGVSSRRWMRFRYRRKREMVIWICWRNKKMKSIIAWWKGQGNFWWNFPDLFSWRTEENALICWHIFYQVIQYNSLMEQSVTYMNQNTNNITLITT